MNYKESGEILERIKKAKRILVNLHRGPDPDSFGSALALYQVLANMGKNVDVVCTSSNKFMTEINFLPNIDKIKKVDFEKFDFDAYELFITTDTQSWQHIVDNPKVGIPDIPIVVIDHHPPIEKYGIINLIDLGRTSCAELLFLVFKDWEIDINKEIATCLLTGIVGDTNNFQFASDSKTFVHTAELMEMGGMRDLVVDNLYRSESLENIKLWGEFLIRYERDLQNFIYTAIPEEIYKQYGKPAKAQSRFATYFGSIVEGIKFSVIMLEKEKGVVDVSLRSKVFDISKIAMELGGGGHPVSSGCRVEGLVFDKAVEKVLEVARKYARQ